MRSVRLVLVSLSAPSTTVAVCVNRSCKMLIKPRPWLEAILSGLAGAALLPRTIIAPPVPEHHTTSPVATGGFGGLSPPDEASSPPS